MKIFFRAIFFSFFFFSVSAGFSQSPGCPQITPIATPATICQGQCTALTATAIANNQTSSYSVAAIPYSPYPYTGGTGVSVGTDDVWSPVVNLGFNFCFYGTSYSQVVLGSNGQICFNTAKANAYDAYHVNTAVPSTANMPGNSIFLFRDIDPSVSGSVKYYITGSAPCRALVFYFKNVALYSCTNPKSTFQFVLYENTNFIDIYVENSSGSCSWESGNGILGIQNAAASNAVCPPGRNIGNWTATNEAWRFYPTGASSYAVTWYGPSGTIGTGLGPINVCPTSNTTYTASMAVTNCDGAVTTYTGTTLVTVNTSPTASAGPSKTLNCIGTPTTLTASGGGTYSWSGPGIVSGGSTASPSVNQAGVYTVSVTASGCTSTATTQVSSATPPTASVSKTDVICGAAGSATAAASGGTGPYTYSWSPSGGSAATASGFSAGTYSVTVTDANSCVSTSTVSIANTGTGNASFTSSSNQCLTGNSFNFTNTGSTGTHTWVFTGGTPSSSSSASPTGITYSSAGTYTVSHTVNAGGSCVDTKTASVVVYPNPTGISTTSVNATCGLSNASFTVSGSGGTPAYNYSINGGAFSTTSSTMNIPSGTYSISVRDVNNCTYSTTINITNTPGPTALTLAGNNASCGSNNGSINTPTVTGGTPTYSYSINGGAYSSSPTLSGLASGTYSVNVKDANNCLIGNSVNIGNNTGPTDVTLTSNATNCSGSTGTYSIGTVSGGTPTYSYSINGGAYSTVTNYTGQSAGSYSVTVKDANGCTYTKNIVVSVTPGPTAMTVVSTNAACGSANGSASVTATSGGTPAYQYQIDGGSTNATGVFSGLSAGNHTVSVTDVNSCSYSTAITVGNNGSPTASVSSFSNVSCFGGSNGSFTVTASGGSGSFTYSISPGGITNGTGIFTNLTAQGYLISVKDASNCVVSTSVTINQPTALTVSLNPTDVTCNGLSNGSLTSTGNGGSAGYQYSLNGGAYQASGAFSSLLAGTYNVTVKDANNCTYTSSVTVNQPSPLTVAVTSGSANCSAANGTISVSPSGGTPSYTYSWSPSGGTGSTTTGLSSGNYTVVVTDNHGCQKTVSAAVGLISGGTATISSIANTSCFGANNGSMTVSMTGNSTPPFVYSWSPTGGSSASATNLSPGTYTVLVTDAYGCTSFASGTISQPAKLDGTTSFTNVACFGGNSGAASVVGSGGTSPYTYNWSPVASTSTVITNLSSGDYICTIHDQAGCTTSKTITIVQSSSISVTSSVTTANCNQSDGAAGITVSGGTPGYTYNWSNGSTNSSISSVSANTYSVTVKDANNCSTAIAVTIPNSAGPTMSVTSVGNVKCNGGNDGYATVSVTGGTNPYVYQWSNLQNTPGATNLSAGLYTVSATDQNGCVVSTSVSITQPNALSLTIAGTDPKCHNASNGTASVSVTGGVPGYSYSWTNGAGSAASATSLSSGNYVVLVTDANNCVSSTSIALNNPAALAVSITNTAVTCYNTCNGLALATPINQAGTVTYSWSGNNPQSTALASGLCAGSYSVFITDQNGCQATGITTITEPTALTASVTSLGNVSCNGGNNGYASISVNGGTPAYTYSWTNGGSSANTNSLSAGSYTATVTDQNGCRVNAPVVITQPAALSNTVSGTDVKCYNACDGQASVNYSGGTGPYTFLWTPSLVNTANASGLCEGTHTITITDLNNCISTGTIALYQPNSLVATTTASNSNCGQANGNACVNVSGGTPPFNYLWSNGVQTLCDFNIVAGAYSVTVTDANTCTISAIANINDIAAPAISVDSYTNVSCHGGSDGSVITTISGGVAPYTISWSTGQTIQNPLDLTAGLNAITVVDQAGCISSASVQITEPAPLVTAVLSQTNTSCYNTCDGLASIGVNGGTTPYSYTWNNSQTNSIGSALCAGIYTCVVTDAKSCSKTQTVNILQPAQLVISNYSITNATCHTYSNGAISTTVTGGAPGYTYSWSPSSAGTSGAASGLSFGVYDLIVSDSKGCTTTGNYVVNEPAAITDQIVGNFSTCGQSNGSVDVFSLAGGTAPYQYYWNTSPNAFTPTVNNLAAGNYTCIITDANGCVKTETVTIFNASSPVIDSVKVTNPTCFGQLNGQLEVFTKKGTPPFQFSWSNPIGTVSSPTVSNVGAGTYTLSMTDLYGCSAATIVSVTQPNMLYSLASHDTILCYGQSTQIYASAGGGTLPYTYSWTPSGLSGPGPHTINSTSSTDYTVSIIDSKGCSTSPKTISVIVKPALSAVGYSVAACNLDSVTLTPNITSPGNGAPYTYIWNTGATSSSIKIKANILATPVTYTVTVKDGCSIPDGKATFTLVVNPLPNGTFTANPLEKCSPLPATFTATSNGSGDTYDWIFGDGKTGTGSPITHQYVDTGKFSVTLIITNIYGCKMDTTRSNFIYAYPRPVASFYADPNPSTIANPIINFHNTSQGANNYFWDFGDPGSGSSNTSIMINPSHAYEYAGTYNVFLVAISNYGCRDTASVAVVIEPEFALYIPNAFTPDGNGKNDVFQPVGIGIDEDKYTMQIYDRWGEVVYTSNNFKQGWDGHAKGSGKLAEQNVYVYKIIVFDIFGEKHSYVGHVTLLKNEP